MARETLSLIYLSQAWPEFNQYCFIIISCSTLKSNWNHTWIVQIYNTKLSCIKRSKKTLSDSFSIKFVRKESTTVKIHVFFSFQILSPFQNKWYKFKSDGFHFTHVVTCKCDLKIQEISKTLTQTSDRAWCLLLDTDWSHPRYLQSVLMKMNFASLQLFGVCHSYFLYTHVQCAKEIGDFQALSRSGNHII